MFRTKGLLSVWIVSLLSIGSWADTSSAQDLGPEFQVNSYTTGQQYQPAVAADSAGNFAVVWESKEQDGSNRSVFGQRYDAEGNALGSEFRVNTYTTGYQFRSSVAMEDNGDFVVVWQSSDPGLTNDDIIGQRYDSAGVALGGEFLINTYTTGKQSRPDVAADDAGNFVVVWQSGLQPPSFIGIWGQRYDSVGVALGGEFQVHGYVTGTHLYPAVSSDDEGNFVVVWGNSYQDGDSFGIFAQRFDSAGGMLGTEFQVNNYTTSYQLEQDVATYSEGNFIVVWNSNDQDGDSRGVFGQRFASDGVEIGGEFQVNSYTTGNQYRPSVAASKSGDFTVVWYDRGGQDGDSSGIFAQRYDSSGGRAGGEFQVNSYTTGFQGFVGIAATDSGRLPIAWNDTFGHDGDRAGIFGRQLTTPFFSDGFESGDTCVWTGTCP